MYKKLICSELRLSMSMWARNPPAGCSTNSPWTSTVSLNMSQLFITAFLFSLCKQNEGFFHLRRLRQNVLLYNLNILYCPHKLSFGLANQRFLRSHKPIDIFPKLHQNWGSTSHQDFTLCAFSRL
jgi:hypothetical protein